MAEEETKNPSTGSGQATEAKEAAPAPEPARAEQAGVGKKAETAEETVEVPAEFKNLIETIEKMSVLELHKLVKVMEKKFGVSAQAVAVAAPAAGGAAAAGGEEKSDFTVELADMGPQKTAVIKAVKEVLGLGLKEAKDLVDAAPSVLKEGVKKEQAEEWKQKIEAAGGKVELK